MKISARNQIKGTIESITKGSVNAMVTLKTDTIKITGTISINAVDELELKEGVEAIAIIKATDVMIGLGDLKISARNQIKGTITEIVEGAVNSIVKLSVDNNITISSTISKSAIEELDLRVGTKASAIIKATSVMFGV
ncbi:TOBE domain-containing protein [Anaerosporobacter sp.]